MRQGPARLPEGLRRAGLRHRAADGRRFERLLLFVPDLHGRLQRQLVDDEGKLLVDDPKVKEGLAGALKDYTDPYTKGCVPPSATSWKDPDNNVAFHNKTTVLTHNATISIAAKWLDDMNNETLTAEQRAQAKKNYEEADPHRRLPEQARRRQDGVPHRGEDRRRLRGGQEQGEGQGVRPLPARGGEPHALCRRRARTLVPGDQGGAGAPVLEGRSAPPVGLQPVCKTAP